MRRYSFSRALARDLSRKIHTAKDGSRYYRGRNKYGGSYTVKLGKSNKSSNNTKGFLKGCVLVAAFFLALIFWPVGATILAGGIVALILLVLRKSVFQKTERATPAVRINLRGSTGAATRSVLVKSVPRSVPEYARSPLWEKTDPETKAKIIANFNYFEDQRKAQKAKETKV